MEQFVKDTPDDPNILRHRSTFLQEDPNNTDLSHHETTDVNSTDCQDKSENCKAKSSPTHNDVSTQMNNLNCSQTSSISKVDQTSSSPPSKVNTINAPNNTNFCTSKCKEISTSTDNQTTDNNSSNSPPSNYDGCTFRRLLHRSEIPSHLQFNPYINTGYRPLLSVWECILSLFYLHNETVNIITHGIPMLYIFVMWRTLVPWDEIKIPILPWIHLMSCVSPWVGSTIYHMFMNHRAGAKCYRSLLRLDMFGIWITQSFGALTTVYASVSCVSKTYICVVLFLYCFVSLWCLYKASHARNPWERRFCFTLPFLMRAASLILRVSSTGGGEPLAINHILLQDLLAVVGGFVGALRIPEKWLPGRLDLVCNSHHIMHVVVVWAVYHLHQGAILDMLWLSRNPQCPGLMNSSSLL